MRDACPCDTYWADGSAASREALGFLIVTTIFMAAMIYCLGERSWRVLAMVPPLSAIALYAVFAVWLRVPLPKGILTFIG